MTGIEALADWIQRTGDRRHMTNEWLYASDMKVYVRRGFRPCGICLDVAAVEVYDKGKGTFTKFLEAAHEMNPWDVMFCECVQNARLVPFLEKKGYRRYGEDDDPAPSLYLKKGP